jgi:hypothetical protein
MTTAQNTVPRYLLIWYIVLIVDMSAVKLPVEVKQNNLPPECG